MKKILMLIACLLVLTSLPVLGAEQKNQVYFDGEVESVVKSLIQNSKKTLDIEVFLASDCKPIIEALRLAAERGVTVHIIVDNQEYNKPNTKTGFPETLLEKSGIVVRWERTGRTMHRKFAVADGEVIFLGSSNWTINSFEENNEINLYVRDREIAGKIELKFKQDWDFATGTFKTLDQKTPPEEPPECYYIAATTTGKIHKSYCVEVDDINPENRVRCDKLEDALKKYPGKEKCKICFKSEKKSK